MMSEEPQFPPIPDIGDILKLKEGVVQKITSVIKCRECLTKYDRPFKPGDFTFKTLMEEECSNCNQKGLLVIEEIFSEWMDQKKGKIISPKT